MSAEEFEELRRQFERQFRKIPKVPVKGIAGIAGGIVVLVLVLIAAFSSFYTVEADEVGVVLRFGKFIETTDPGLHFKLPFGVDKVTLVKVNRVHKEEFGFRTVSAGQRTQYSNVERDDESIMLTADLGIADVEWIIQYKIKSADNFLFNVKNLAADGQPSTLRDISEHVVRLEVGDSSIDEVLTLRRREIAINAKKRLQDILDKYEAGIEIVTVELQSVNPPEKVRDSFNEVNRAIQEKQTSINEARKEWNKEIPSATGEAAQKIEEAEGYKTKRINEALGNVARYNLLLEEYVKAKEVTRTRLYLETIEEVLPQVPQIYVVDDRQEGPLQILDLKQAAGARTTTQKKTNTSTPNTTRRR